MADFDLEDFLESESYLDSITLHARDEWHQEVFVRAAGNWFLQMMLSRKLREDNLINWELVKTKHRLRISKKLKYQRKDESRIKEKKIKENEVMMGSIGSIKQDFTQIVEGIMSDNREQQMSSTFAAKDKLSCESREKSLVDDFIQAGIVPKLVGFLRREDMPELQCQSCLALTEIFCGTSEQTQSSILYGVIPAFVSLITSRYTEIAKQAVCSLGKIACIGAVPRDEVLHDLIQAGIVPKLVDFLQREDTPDLQFYSCWALTEIFCGTSEQTKYLVMYGAIPAFVSLITSRSTEIAAQAVFSLGTIAGIGAVLRDEVLRCNILRPLLKLIDLATPLSILRNVAWTLSVLCRNEDSHPPFDQVNLCLPGLKDLLTFHDEEILASTCWALSNIADASDDRIQQVVDAGLIPRILELLNAHAANIVTPALICIKKIIFNGTGTQTDAVLSQGLLQVLARLLNHSKVDIVQQAAFTISIITAGNPGQIQAVLDSGCLEPLISVLEKGDFTCQEFASYAVTNLTMGGTVEQVIRICQADAIKPICDLLSVNDGKILQVLLRCLENILETGRKINELSLVVLMIEECGGLDKIESLRLHENTKVHEKAASIIEKYFSDEKANATETADDGSESKTARKNRNSDASSLMKRDKRRRTEDAVKANATETADDGSESKTAMKNRNSDPSSLMKRVKRRRTEDAVASTISSVPAILSVNIQAERPVTPVVALVPPTPSTEAQPTEGPSEGASTSQAKSIEQEAPVSESGTSVQKPKRQREPDSTPDESLKKRTREEELSQEPVTETPESIQREADLRRSLLAARRTTGLAVTVKEGLRSAVVQPSSSAIEEIEISSGSENEPTWEEGNDEVSYDEGEVTEVSEDIEEDEEASEEEQSNDDSGLSSENEATVGEEMMAINEQRGELEHPESSLAEQPSRSEIGDENGEVPLSKASSPKKQRSGDSSNEMGTSTQVAARPFMFGVSPAMEGQTSGTRDFEATDAGQLEEGEGLEVLFEEVAEVSTSGQEASAGDGTEMVDSPASGNDGTAMAQSSSLQAGSVRGSQGYTRGGSTLRRRFHRQQISASADFIAPDFTSPQQISADFTSPQRQQISSQHQFSASGGRARRSRGSFKRTKHYCGC